MRRRLIDSIVTLVVGITTAVAAHAFGPPALQSYWLNKIAYQRNIGKNACLDGEYLGRILGVSLGPWRESGDTSSVWKYVVALRPPQLIEKWRNGSSYRVSTSFPVSFVVALDGACPDGRP